MKADVVEVMAGIAVAIVIGAVAVVGCGRQTASEPARTVGVAEKAGIAADKAAQKTVEEANAVAEKSGKGLEEAGAAVEKVGADMQK